MSRRSYFLIACLLSRAILYLFIQTSGVGLMPDEAQYWTWSLLPDVGYYSKPPGIAWQIALGTAFFGSTSFGVRFVALMLPILSALVVRAIVRQLVHDSDGWLAATAFILSPLGTAGAFLATTDAGMVLFWLLAAYWYLRLEGRPTRFFAAALFIALGALWKWMSYSFWLVVFASNPKRWRPLLAAILLSGIGLVPSLLWNWEHSWAGFCHVGATIFDQHSSHASANPIQFFLAGVALVTPGFFLLGLPALKERRARFVSLGIAVILGGLLVLSLFRKVQGNWAVIAQALFFPLIGVVLSQKPAWQRWPYRAAVAIAVACQLFVLATPYTSALSICPFKQGLGHDYTEALQRAGYVPGRDFLFSDRYQTTSLLWFYGPFQQKAYFFNLRGLRHNQFSYWPGMQQECRGRRGFFVTFAEGGSPLLSKYRSELLQYFSSVAPPQIATLYSTWGAPVRRMLIFVCDGYSGSAPEETKKF